MSLGGRPAPPTLCFGARKVDLSSGEVGSQDARLSPTERALLQRLAASVGEVVPAEDLLVEVWGYHPNVASRTLATTVARLRSRLEPEPGRPRYLLTVQGRGYLLASEALPDAERPALPGREAEIQHLLRWLNTGAGRWLTVIGPGGIGKSALLAELGRRDEVRRRFPGGVRPLSPAPGDADAVRSALTQPGALLLVDCEDLDPSPLADHLSDQLAQAAARVVAAARLPLDIRGEGVLPLGPLSPEDSAAALRLDRRHLASASGGLPLALRLIQGATTSPPPPGAEARPWLEALHEEALPPRHQSLAANRRSTWEAVGLSPQLPAGWPDGAHLDSLARAGLLIWAADGSPHLPSWLNPS